MKTYILLIVICIIVNQFASAQITNTFPLDDSVGIGTTTPTELFQVNGSIKIAGRIFNETEFAIGYETMKSNISGVSNTAVGDESMANNISGSYNTTFGNSALEYNISGNSNTAIGLDCMLNNVGGNYNTAVGFTALHGSGIGSYNTAMGSNTLYNCIKGSYNTSVGNENMFNTLKGNYNTSIGSFAMTNNKNGNNNTIIGYGAETSTANLNNTTALGNGSIVDASNKVRIGNASVTSNGGQVSWTAYSDARIKNNIQENVPGLEFINLLKPITYHFDIDKQNDITGLKNREKVEGMYEIEKIQFTGFLAQDVEVAAKRINYDFSGVDKSGEVLGLRYAEFVVPLVKAVQELSAENEELKKQIATSNNTDEVFEKRIAKLEKQQSKSSLNHTEEVAVQEVKLSSDNTAATLYQNMPNPFSGRTDIRYFVPENVSNAFIKIVNANGASLFTADIKLGAGILEIDASQLAAGTYSYTLIVDGKVIDTKLMVLQH